MATAVTRQEVAVQSAPGKRRFTLAPYLFILPHLIFFGVFIAYPFFNGLFISTESYNFLRPDRTQFVGLQNYVNLFTPDSVQFQPFWSSLWNTVQFVIYSVPALVILPLGLAVLLNIKIPGRNFFRAVYFAPWVLSIAMVGLLWWWIFNSQGGLINYYLGQLHLPQPEWLSTLPWAWVAIVVATVWWTLGFNMIILLAALQDIPDYLYEAADIDGANSIQKFWRITIPMLRPVLLFIITISIIASFNLFGQPFLMTNGGPALPQGGGATTPVMVQIYNEGFSSYNLGSAAAMSFLVAIIMIVVSIGNFKLFQQRD
jgi:multiple sugar transport system permease protein